MRPSQSLHGPFGVSSKSLIFLCGRVFLRGFTVSCKLLSLQHFSMWWGVPLYYVKGAMHRPPHVVDRRGGSGEVVLASHRAVAARTQGHMPRPRVLPQACRTGPLPPEISLTEIKLIAKD